MSLLNFAVYAQKETVQGNVPFNIPTLTDILTFLIRFFFVAAGLAALLYLLLGAFAWITSGGSKENVDKARDKIQAAVVGVILVVVVLAIVVLFEQVIFAKKIGLGITCPLTIPSIFDPDAPSAPCK